MKDKAGTPHRRSNPRNKEDQQQKLNGKPGEQETQPSGQDRFALSSYQTAPDASQVPMPPACMLARAAHARAAWLPATTPVPPKAESSKQGYATSEDMTMSLMKMLGISQAERADGSDGAQ